MIPQQNGIAERMNRTLMEKARSLRLQASLPKSFWGDAVTFAYFLINRSPHRKLNGGIPEEVWSGKKVELGHLKRSMISRNIIFDEKSTLKKLEGADEAEKSTQDSIGQHSHTNDLPSISTFNHIYFEVEKSRHVPTPVEDQRGG
ncbi:uncharacterized protein [Elaeis guineensis]|uniref:uncharacterized protein n=1 Tax=Elaeis guineensis var. tenera TaxID=51953 RepID=UPI003C6D7EAE